MTTESLTKLDQARTLFAEGIKAAKEATRLVPKDVLALIKADQEKLKAAIEQARDAAKAHQAAIKEATLTVARRQKEVFAAAKELTRQQGEVLKVATNGSVEAPPPKKTAKKKAAKKAAARTA